MLFTRLLRLSLVPNFFSLVLNLATLISSWEPNTEVSVSLQFSTSKTGLKSDCESLLLKCLVKLLSTFDIRKYNRLSHAGYPDNPQISVVETLPKTRKLSTQEKACALWKTEKTDSHSKHAHSPS